MDGKEADPKTGLFTFKSGNTTPGPRLSGIPDEDINCRCTTRLEIKNLPKKILTNKSIDENKIFDEWADEKGIKTKLVV
jgi:hypothetical protein